jgi:hypothetical protein
MREAAARFSYQADPRFAWLAQSRHGQDERAGLLQSGLGVLHQRSLFTDNTPDLECRLRTVKNSLETNHHGIHRWKQRQQSSPAS